MKDKMISSQYLSFETCFLYPRIILDKKSIRLNLTDVALSLPKLKLKDITYFISKVSIKLQLG